MTAHVVLQHQDLLRNVGVYNSILTILRLPLRRTTRPGELDAAENPDRARLFGQCYKFLQAFCAGNPGNQELVFSNVDLFFSHVGTEGLDVAPAIQESVHGNRALAAQVNDAVFRTFIQVRPLS